jgi:3-phosphoshikimate 1-carboxyvinyltransferase
MVLAAALHGAGFTGTGRLKMKESDRGFALQQELGKMKVSMQLSENEIRIDPGVCPPQEILDGHNDHRIVMALSVLAACAQKPVSIEGAGAVNKSYPGFFSDLEKTGMEVTYD